jgi:hypothetical protein
MGSIRDVATASAEGQRVDVPNASRIGRAGAMYRDWRGAGNRANAGRCRLYGHA